MRDMIAPIALTAALAAGAALIGHFDYQSAQTANQTYREMVTAWQQDAARGIPPADRAGWPPYRGPVADSSDEESIK